jgi:uncharacterized protein DUF4340
MSAQQLKLVALGLAVLLLLWGGSELFSRGSDTVTGSLAFPPLAPADVDSIALLHGSDSVVLVKQSATAWTVNGHRAVAADVTALLQALKDTIRPEVVAQDVSSFARLQVDSAGGRWLWVFRGGKPVVQVIVGGRGSDYQSVYLRRPGDARVYLWRGALVGMAERRADDWRDKRIAALVPDSITALDVERGKDRYGLKRAGKAWTLNGGAADSAAVRRYLERLKSISAAGFATPKEADSTKALRPKRRLSVRGAHGVLLSLAFDSTPGAFVVRHLAGGGGEGATVYRMNTWDVDGVTPASQSLKPATKPVVKPAPQPSAKPAKP